jgi:hypothetical protein
MYLKHMHEKFKGSELLYGWEENGVEFYTLGYGFDILFVRVFEVSGKIHHSIDKKIVNGFNAHGISEDDIEETL